MKSVISVLHAHPLVDCFFRDAECFFPPSKLLWIRVVSPEHFLLLLFNVVFRRNVLMFLKHIDLKFPSFEEGFRNFKRIV